MPKGDKDILKADPEDGTTPIANLLLEALAIAKLTGKEKGVVLYLWRLTYGWMVNGKRLKEIRMGLDDWAKITQADKSKTSTILTGLTKKHILKRQFIGPGQGYSYSMNTRVAEWDNSCLNRQRLSELVTERLPKTTTVALSKTTTPSDTNLATLKESIKESIKKERTHTPIIFQSAHRPDADVLRLSRKNTPGSSTEPCQGSELYQEDAGPWLRYFRGIHLLASKGRGQG